MNCPGSVAKLLESQSKSEDQWGNVSYQRDLQLIQDTWVFMSCILTVIQTQSPCWWEGEYKSKNISVGSSSCKRQLKDKIHCVKAPEQWLQTGLNSQVSIQWAKDEKIFAEAPLTMKLIVCPIRRETEFSRWKCLFALCLASSDLPKGKTSTTGEWPFLLSEPFKSLCFPTLSDTERIGCPPHVRLFGKYIFWMQVKRSPVLISLQRCLLVYQLVELFPVKVEKLLSMNLLVVTTSFIV